MDLGMVRFLLPIGTIDYLSWGREPDVGWTFIRETPLKTKEPSTENAAGRPAQTAGQKVFIFLKERLGEG
jgi:hypothetical protein